MIRICQSTYKHIWKKFSQLRVYSQLANRWRPVPPRLLATSIFVVESQCIKQQWIVDEPLCHSHRIFSRENLYINFFPFLSVIRVPGNFDETIIIVTASFPQHFISNVSELFPGGGEEWKDQYTKEYQSTIRFYLFQFISPVVDCPSALDHISQLDIISFSFSSQPVLDLSTHSNLTAWSIRDIQVYSTV